MDPPTEQFTPLVFNDIIDTSNMVNVLLIDSSVDDKRVFYDSANANTFPIIYSYNSSTEDLLALFRQKFPASSIQRISLVSHANGPNYIANFMNNKLLFDERDLVEGQTSFTENVSFLIRCINEFHVGNIDFLACNTLQYSNWQSYYALLGSQTSVVVGASNDATGNIKYGGNWIMESTGQDIEKIYFTDGIEYYKYLLVVVTINNVIYTYPAGIGCRVTGFVPGIVTANIESVVADYNVISIGVNAFLNCTTLTTIVLPVFTLNFINDTAFSGCIALTSIVIPNNVISIGTSAFKNCTSLASVTLPTNSNLTLLSPNAFENCTSLTSVTIRTTISELGSSAFKNCTSLASVSMPTSLRIIGISTFEGCSSLTSVSIPSVVTDIQSSAFKNCTKLASVTLPTTASFTNIPVSAFQGCSSLTSVTIPNVVRTISSNAFDGCTKLASVTLPTNASFTNIQGSAFQGCGLTSITIPNSVTTIGTSAFQNCNKLVSATISRFVTSIGTSAYQSCTLLNAFVVDAANPNFSSDASGVLFNKLQTTLVQYPIGNTRNTYTIPSSVATITSNAFYDCNQLVSVNIPTSVTTIGTSAFQNCTLLNAFVVDAANPNFSSDASGVLFNKFQTTLLQYPIGNTRNTYTIPSSVTSIGTFAFYGCTSFTSATISSSVTSIGISAYQTCSNLNLVNFLQTPLLPTIGANAFAGIKTPSVGRYIATATNSSTIAPLFTSISTLPLPTLTSEGPFESGSPLGFSVISYADLVANGNASVESGLTYVFLVNAVLSGSLSIGTSQGSATPWNATTNKTIAAGNNAYWTPTNEGVSGLFNAFSVVIQDSFGLVSSPNVDVVVGVPYACFLEGSKILCFENNEEVYRPVESMRKGDLVKTIYNGYMPVNMIGTTKMYNPGNDDRITNRLYKCSKENYPTLFEDLYITGCHSILVPVMTDDQWENTKAANGDVFVTDNHFRLVACADEKAEPFNKEGFMTIYHIALDHHDVCMNYGIYANGLLVESSSIESLIIYPNMKIIGQEDCGVSQDGCVSNNMMCQLVDTC